MRLGLVVVLAGLSACATVYRRYDFERMLASTAAAEMSCPQAQLVITPLGEAMVEGTDLPVQERVEGCRRRFDYRVTAAGYQLVAPGWDGLTREDLYGCGAGSEIQRAERRSR